MRHDICHIDEKICAVLFNCCQENSNIRFTIFKGLTRCFLNTVKMLDSLCVRRFKPIAFGFWAQYFFFSSCASERSSQIHCNLSKFKIFKQLDERERGAEGRYGGYGEVESVWKERRNIAAICDWKMICWNWTTDWISVTILLLFLNDSIFHEQILINFWCEWVCVASEIKHLRTQEEGEEEIVNILKSLNENIYHKIYLVKIKRIRNEKKPYQTEFWCGEKRLLLDLLVTAGGRQRDRNVIVTIGFLPTTSSSYHAFLHSLCVFSCIHFYVNGCHSTRVMMYLKTKHYGLFESIFIPLFLFFLYSFCLFSLVIIISCDRI